MGFLNLRTYPTSFGYTLLFETDLVGHEIRAHRVEDLPFVNPLLGDLPIVESSFSEEPPKILAAPCTPIVVCVLKLYVLLAQGGSVH